MSNFRRAVNIALRHQFIICGIAVCSIMVALFWGLNISTIYSVVDIVFHDKSVGRWIDDQVDEVKPVVSDLVWRQRELNRQIATLSSDDATSLDDATRQRLTRERGGVNGKLELAVAKLSRLILVQPYAHQYLPSDPFMTLVVVVCGLLIGTVIKLIFLMCNLILVERLAQLVAFEMRKEFYRKTLRMGVGAFGDDRTPEMMSRFTNDMTAVISGVHTIFGKTLREPLKAAVCLMGAAWICPRLLVVCLIISPLAAVIISRLAKSIKRANRRAMEEMAQVYNHLSDTFGGIIAVKAFTMERYERRRFHHMAKEYFHRAMRIATYTALTRPATELMGMAIICLAMLCGGYLVVSQETTLFGITMTAEPITIGAMITFYAFLIGVSDPARKLADVIPAIQRASAGADRVYEMMDREPSVKDSKSPVAIPLDFKAIRFKNVDFAYNDDQPVLKDLTLDIPAGKAVAIVGANGCGKSTLVKLIPRFYDVNSGSVALDDVELPDVALSQLRQQIGLVTQQTLLFDDTVMNNIRYGSPAATDEQVVKAAKRAHAHRFIEEQLSDGYQTNVGEKGGKLSGGQRQRIALARAILRDPSILILDEATSQIDIESEQAIHQALREFIRGRTTIMITHRLSTLDLADLIIVMEDGEVLDIGQHQELLQRCSFYQSLHQHGLRDAS
jgi:subfamily B ATP-binding cassette protein MsbA